MRVLFWGTPEFAAPPLRALLGEGFDVIGVVTQPDRAVGRSRSRSEPPPIKRIAVEEGVPVLQPERPRGAEFVTAIGALQPDISVVVAYGHILPTDVIEQPRFGTINIHASLLPAMRGAAPIQAAIRDGYTETGITIMRMVKALDAGPIILQARTSIPDDETFGELQLRLAEMGAMAVIESLALIELGRSTEVDQIDAEATYAPKIDRSMARIDWAQSATVVSRLVRAYDPRPGAVAAAPHGDVKLFGARVASLAPAGPPGTMLSVDAGGMIVACGSGSVQIVTVHPAGKRRVAAQDWVRGRGMGPGERLF